MDVPEGLDNKVGSFPVWVWGLAVGGVFLVWMYVRRSQSATSAPANLDATMGGTYGYGSLSPSTDTGVIGEGSTANNPTNQTWESAAVMNADQFGGNPLGVQSAVDKYLNGESLNAAEQSAVNKVLAYLGPPPESILGSVNGDTSILVPKPVGHPSTTLKSTPAPSAKTPRRPAPKPQHKPQTSQVHYRAVWGDTLDGIAKRYGTTAQDIQKLNPSITNINRIYAGTTYRIK